MICQKDRGTHAVNLATRCIASFKALQDILPYPYLESLESSEYHKRSKIYSRKLTGMQLDLPKVDSRVPALAYSINLDPAGDHWSLIPRLMLRNTKYDLTA